MAGAVIEEIRDWDLQILNGMPCIATIAASRTDLRVRMQKEVNKRAAIHTEENRDKIRTRPVLEAKKVDMSAGNDRGIGLAALRRIPATDMNGMATNVMMAIPHDQCSPKKVELALETGTVKTEREKKDPSRKRRRVDRAFWDNEENGVALGDMMLELLGDVAVPF